MLLGKLSPRLTRSIIYVVNVNGAFSTLAMLAFAGGGSTASAPALLIGVANDARATGSGERSRERTES